MAQAVAGCGTGSRRTRERPLPDACTEGALQRAIRHVQVRGVMSQVRYESIDVDAAFGCQISTTARRRGGQYRATQPRSSAASAFSTEAVSGRSPRHR